MNKTFRQVLVPISFSVDPGMMAERIGELLGKGRGALHLICVVNTLKVAVHQPWLAISSSNITESVNFKRAESLLEQWRLVFRKQLPSALLSSEIITGVSLQKAILHCINKVDPDIVVMSEKNARLASELSVKTNHTVLTLLGDEFVGQVETLVIPIGNLVPHKRLASIVESFNKQNFKLYLVSTGKGDEAASTRNTTETFRIIKSTLLCDVEHRVIEGASLVKATRAFARLIKADAILFDLHKEEDEFENGSSSEMRPYKNRPYLFNN